MFQPITQLMVAEDGGTLSEFSLFVGMMVLAGVGFFCFTAGQFREVFQSSYRIR